MDIEREGKKLTQGDSFVYLGGAVCADGKTEREVRRRVQAGAKAWRAELWWGDGGPADLKQTKEQGHDHLCDTGMPVRNGNFGTDRTTTKKRLQLCGEKIGTKNSKSNDYRQEKVGLREDTGVQRSLTDYRRERQSYVRRAGGDERGQG